MMHHHAFPHSSPVWSVRPALPACPPAALRGFALLKDKQVGVAYGSHFLFALVQGEIVQHLQVSHGVLSRKGMTRGAADGMEATFLPLLRNRGSLNEYVLVAKPGSRGVRTGPPPPREIAMFTCVRRGNKSQRRRVIMAKTVMKT